MLPKKEFLAAPPPPANREAAEAKLKDLKKRGKAGALRMWDQAFYTFDRFHVTGEQKATLDGMNLDCFIVASGSGYEVVSLTFKTTESVKMWKIPEVVGHRMRAKLLVRTVDGECIWIRDATMFEEVEKILTRGQFFQDAVPVSMPERVRLNTNAYCRCIWYAYETTEIVGYIYTDRDRQIEQYGRIHTHSAYRRGNSEK
jgi:hypothetical protein